MSSADPPDPPDPLADPLVARILRSPGGQRFLAMDDREMRSFLSSAEATVAASAGADAGVEAQVAARASVGQGQRCDLHLDAPLVCILALAGALTVLEERGYTPQRCAGASAGALVAALVAAGYTAAEIRDIFMTIDFPRLFQRRRTFRFTSRPRYALDPARAWIEGLLSARGLATFGDLAERSTSAAGASRLVVVATDVTNAKLVVLPAQAPELGLDPDELAVAQAVVASMSWPGLFDPVSLANARTGDTVELGDGRYLFEYPFWILDQSPGPPRWPAFIVQTTGARGSAALDPPDSRGDRARAVMEMHSRSPFAAPAAAARAILIPIDGEHPADLDVPRSRGVWLYDQGRRAAEEFTDHFDFEAYLTMYADDDAPGQAPVA